MKRNTAKKVGLLVALALGISVITTACNSNTDVAVDTKPCAQFADNSPQHSECLELQLANLEKRMNEMAPNGVPLAQYSSSDDFYSNMMTYMVLRDLMIGSYGYHLGYGWVPGTTVVIPQQYYGYSYYGRSYTPATFAVVTTNQRSYATTVRSNPAASVTYGNRTVTTARKPQVTSSTVSSYKPRFSGTNVAPSRPVTTTTTGVGSTRTTTGSGITSTQPRSTGGYTSPTRSTTTTTTRSSSGSGFSS